MTKTVNVYIDYVLYTVLKNPTSKFKSGTTIIVQNSDMEKYENSRYRITFDSAGREVLIMILIV